MEEHNLIDQNPDKFNLIVRLNRPVPSDYRKQLQKAECSGKYPGHTRQPEQLTISTIERTGPSMKVPSVPGAEHRGIKQQPRTDIRHRREHVLRVGKLGAGNEV